MTSTASSRGSPKIILALPPIWWRIRERINRLELDPLAHMGRPGRVEGTRELVEYPYSIVYKAFDERREVLVLSILHGAQDRTER
jgi:plasmid stabilization system protein ParE